MTNSISAGVMSEQGLYARQIFCCSQRLNRPPTKINSLDSPSTLPHLLLKIRVLKLFHRLAMIFERYVYFSRKRLRGRIIQFGR